MAWRVSVSAVLALVMASAVSAAPAPLRLVSSPTLCGFRAAVGSAPQVLWVKTRGTHATIHACSRRSGGEYVVSIGPIGARIGRGGLAPAGAKREGDGRTPSGVFPLRDGFGTVADPGLRLGWLRTDSRDVWVDDPASPVYNTHQRTPVRGRWTSAERLAIRPYALAQVIGYNETRRAGRGSAIFLHLGTGGPTAGCVSTSAGALRTLFGWERPGVVMVIS